MSVDYESIFAEYTTPSATGAVLRCFSDIAAKPLCWLWPGRIPLGKQTLLAGDPGLGKSLVALDIVARVTRGTTWPDNTALEHPGSAIILSSEDDPADTIRPRLEAAGADLSKVQHLQAVRRVRSSGETSLEQFSLETDLVELQDAAVSLADLRLILIDPISAYLGDTDSHVNAKVRALLSPLADVASALGTAILLITHLNKSASPALYRASGSIAFVAAARAVWLFAKNPDDPKQRLMLPGKMNLAPDQTGMAYRVGTNQGVPIVDWGGPVSAAADAVLEPEGAERRSERLEAMEWLCEQLANGPVAQRTLRGDAGREGFSYATLRRAKDALGVVAEKGGFQGAWEWRLKDAQPKDAQPRVPQMSTFEQRTESTRFNRSEAAKDAQRVGLSALDVAQDDGELWL
jgi:hypothetical protein